MFYIVFILFSDHCCLDEVSKLFRRPIALLNLFYRPLISNTIFLERGTEEVTFLYKLSAGSSPRSYGINVARLAGLPAAVIELALKQSRAFEDRMLTAQASNGGGSVLGHAGDSGSAGKLCV